MYVCGTGLLVDRGGVWVMGGTQDELRLGECVGLAGGGRRRDHGHSGAVLRVRSPRSWAASSADNPNIRSVPRGETQVGGARGLLLRRKKRDVHTNDTRRHARRTREQTTDSEAPAPVVIISFLPQHIFWIAGPAGATLTCCCVYLLQCSVSSLL